MAVYVDDMYLISLGKLGRMKMSHLRADTTEELLEMVDKIGVQKKWIQKKGTMQEHFDICLSKRTLAIQHGAIEVDMRKLARWVLKGKQGNPLINEEVQIHNNQSAE